MSIPDRLEDQIADFLGRLADVERRLQNQRRKGIVTEVDAAKGTARVKLADDPVTGQPVLSPPIPWKEPAMGTIRFHTPPSVGEHVELVSETGDLTDAVIDTSMPSNSVQRPHDKTGEGVITVGNTRILYKDGALEIETTNATIKANVKIDGDLYVTGDVKNDGKMDTGGIHTDAIGKHV